MSQPTMMIQIPRERMNQAVCECGSTFFELRYQVLCYKGVMSNLQPIIAPTPIYICDNCQMIMEVDKDGFPVNTKPLTP